MTRERLDNSKRDFIVNGLYEISVMCRGLANGAIYLVSNLYATPTVNRLASEEDVKIRRLYEGRDLATFVFG